MPADRRGTFATVKPVKTERTHEENQERAYIAASRRSDRSLEARIESARRASEIHKKRTGRALRVTEQDVVNEEMYEEEDDDLPTQYQRLNAHLQTSSWLFNRKLHDYIATQHGVRNMFLHQQFPGMQPFAAPMPSSSQPTFMNTSMLSPQSPGTATTGFIPMPQPFATQPYSQTMPGYRHAPYNIPQRPHQRSASTSTHQAVQNLSSAPLQSELVAGTPGADANRRMSLPPHVLGQATQQGDETQSRPALSTTLSTPSVSQQPPSPHPLSVPNSDTGTPGLKSEHTSPTSYQFPPFSFDTSSQVLQMNPLSFSLPPEAQQFIGSALDPNDPHTATLMAGSENLPQPSMGVYTYNPNLSPKLSQTKNAGSGYDSPMDQSAPSMAQIPAPEDTSKGHPISADTPPSAMLDHTYTPNHLFTPTAGLDYTSYFGQYHNADNSRSGLDDLLGDSFEESHFVDWDQ